MGACDHCGIHGQFLYRCRYCGGHFCACHHVPPDHSCVRLDLWLTRCSPGQSVSDGDTAVPIRPCASCGTKVPGMLFCTFCGKPYCELHYGPADHNCPGVPAGTAVPALAVVPRTTINALHVAGGIALIALIIVSLLAGLMVAGMMGKETGVPGGMNASSSQEPTFRNTPETTVTPVAVTTLFPQLRVPATIRFTPTSTPVRGIISYPYIVADPATMIVVRNYTFQFQDKTVSISAGVNTSVYNGAKNGEKAVVMNRDGIIRRDWAPGYFRAFIADNHQEGFYDSLISAFRAVRQEMMLTDDEYLELMAVFVQSIPYDNAGAASLENGNRFPVETFVDGKGVCGDKSLLLAGLLSREGFDVALLVFEPEEHMALGVRSAEGYRNTGYAYLETTRISYIGIVPDELAGNITLSSMPYLITIGNGWKVYSALNETVYIRDQYEAALTGISELKEKLPGSRSFPDTYNEMVREYNQYVTMYNYISGHGYDRPGTYLYVTEHATTVPPVTPSSLSGPSYATCISADNVSCPAGAWCCDADSTCYSPCRQGVWAPEDCVCRV